MKQASSSIKIDSSQAAKALLAQTTFLERWRALYERCSWATRFQSPEFVTTWYGVYGNQYDPLILSKATPEGKLVGLLTLAQPQHSSQLVYAGAHQAEYHVWLSEPEQGDSFMEEAATLLCGRFPGHRLTFNFLPPGAPLGWSRKGSACGRMCLLEEIPRPVVNLGDGSPMSAALNKPKTRRQLNMLKRIGDVRFEQLRDPSELDPLFDEIIAYYDSRQGAINDVYPFEQDPLKKRFNLELMSIPELLHVTVLRVNDTVAAAHLGVVGRGTVYLGIPLHNPFLGKHSPGKLHILMLGEYMARCGLSTLDLTPGDTYWKNRFATDQDTVHRLTLASSTSQVLRLRGSRKIRELAKAVLLRLGINPESARATAAGLLRAGIKNRLAGIQRWLWSTTELRIYEMNADHVSTLEYPQVVSRDSVGDLLAFKPMASGQSRSSFLSQSLKRIEDEHHVYTLVEDGRLVHYAWITEGEKKSQFTEVGQEFHFPPRSACIYDALTAPFARGRGLFRKSARQILHETVDKAGTETIYATIRSDNRSSCKVAQDLGFRYSSSLFMAVRFGRVRKWQRP